MTGPEQDRLDEMIEQGLGEIVPGEGVVEEVNPWREPIGRIAAGMALTGITLNFLYLQYLLPTLGAALQYLGFRTLRRSGPAFRIAWGLSLVELVWHAVWLMLSASPWRLEGVTAYTLGLAGMAVQIARLLLLRAGLRDVCRRAEVEPKGDPLRAAVIWQVLIAVLAFSPLAQSWLAAIPMIIAFVLIIQSLERVGGSLGGAGYCFVDAPVRVSSGVMKWGYLLGCFALVLLTSAVVNHPRLDAQPVPAQGEAETRQALAELGLPEEVLADLSDEHVRALEGALRVDVQQEMMSFYSSTTTETQKADADANRLCSYIIYIELPDSRMAVLNYFDWQQGGAYWGDAVMLGWQDTYEYLTGQIGGALLYEKNGQAYTAPIPRLNNGVVTTTDWFSGIQSYPRITGTVSYPFGAQNQRGYVLYILQLRDLGYWGRLNGNTSITYRHRLQPFSLPYQTPAELTSGWTDNTLQQRLGLFQAVGPDGEWVKDW
ncbi:MAG: hypothetical protein ACLRSJ_04920 [Agathobaculum sp.]